MYFCYWVTEITDAVKRIVMGLSFLRSTYSNDNSMSKLSSYQ